MSDERIEITVGGITAPGVGAHVSAATETPGAAS